MQELEPVDLYGQPHVLAHLFTAHDGAVAKRKQAARQRNFLGKRDEEMQRFISLQLLLDEDENAAGAYIACNAPGVEFSAE